MATSSFRVLTSCTVRRCLDWSRRSSHWLICFHATIRGCSHLNINIAHLHTLHNQLAIIFRHVKLSGSCCHTSLDIAHTRNNPKLNCSRLAWLCPYPPLFRDRLRAPRLKYHPKSQSRWKTLPKTYLYTIGFATSSSLIYQSDQISLRIALPSRHPRQADRVLHPQLLQAPSSSKSKDRRPPPAQMTRSQVLAMHFNRTRRTCQSNQPTSATSLKKNIASALIKST